MVTDMKVPDQRSDAHDIDADASPDRIEAQLDAKRADIDRTISQLESRFNPERVVDYLKDNGGEIAGNLGRSFKDNPVPFLLTGVGLAWMMSAQQGSGAQRQAAYPRYRSSRYDGDPYYEEDVSGQRRMSAQPAYGTTYAGTSGSAQGGDDEGTMDRMKDQASRMSADASGRMTAMSDRMSRSGDEARRRLERMRDRAENRYKRMNDDARQRYDGMSSSARLHYDRLSDDAAKQYDTLSDEARRRYDSARRKAQQASRDIGRRANDLGSQSADFLREQPLVAAAIGASIGALIGSLLPPSRTEDRYMGAQADQYRDEARDVAGEKMDTLGAMAGEKVDALGEQARGTMEQVRKDAEQAIEKAGDKAEDAVKQADAKAQKESEKAASKAGTGTGQQG